MVSTTQIHNFSAGPCILPQSVMEQAADAVRELDGSGLSLIEISHRSPAFVAIMAEAQDNARKLLNVPDRFEILFLQGGASLGFLTTACNFLSDGGSLDYAITGTWSKKAYAEAKHVGQAHMITDGAEFGFRKIPKLPSSSSADAVHITTNNTIFGTQYAGDPICDKPLIGDMSSDIFSRSIDFDKYACIYAGAQKNMGPAGTVMYIFDPAKVASQEAALPSYFDLKLHASKDSMFNTPPVFAIYTSMLNMRWMLENGGLAAVEKRNRAKADMMYAEIDRNSLFTGFADVDSRSVMNATFTAVDESIEPVFKQRCAEAGINGVNGHKSVGGFRASMYNALPLESVAALVEVMQEIERTHG
jgi:phosphoserine aminotransferase